MSAMNSSPPSEANALLAALLDSLGAHGGAHLVPALSVTDTKVAAAYLTMLHNTTQSCPAADPRSESDLDLHDALGLAEAGELLFCQNCSWTRVEFHAAAGRFVLTPDLDAHVADLLMRAQSLSTTSTLDELEAVWLEAAPALWSLLEHRSEFDELARTVTELLRGSGADLKRHSAQRLAARKVKALGLSATRTPAALAKAAELEAVLVEELSQDPGLVVLGSYDLLNGAVGSGLALPLFRAHRLGASDLTALPRVHHALLTDLGLFLPVSADDFLVLEEDPGPAVLEALSVLFRPGSDGTTSTLAGALEVARAL
jgi:hypothetical protein